MTGVTSWSERHLYTLLSERSPYCNCEWKLLPAVSASKGCCSHQAITLQPPLQWAQRELRSERGRLTCSSHLLQPFSRARPEETGMRKAESWGASQRVDFREPRLLHPPTLRKVLNSSTGAIWFSLVNNDLWCSNCLVFVTKTSIYLDSHPCLFRPVPQSYLRGCVPSLNPQFCPPNKT